MKTVEFKSLNHKLLASVLLTAVSFACAATAFSFMTEFNRANEKTKTMIKQLIDTVEGMAAIAAYAGNQHIAQDVLNGLIRNDVVHKVRITGDHGLDMQLDRGTPYRQNAEISRDLLSPFDNKQVIGRLSITPEGYFNLEEAKHGAIVNAATCFILIALTTTIILLVVRASFSRPLTVVSDTLHAITAGEQDRLMPLDKHRNDELGRLIADINGLLDALEHKFSDERALRQQIEAIEIQLRDIFESTSAGLFLLDPDGKLLTSNPTMIRILAQEFVDAKSIIGQDFAELFFQQPEKVRLMIQNAYVFDHLEAQDLMLRQNNDQDAIWVHFLLSKVVDSSGNICFEGVVFDVTKRVAIENAVRFEAEHDPLTGLLRRYPAELKLKSYLAHVDSAAATVLLLDLDGFKQANDTYGHDVGDRVLIETAKRMQTSVRANDVVARLGGDEFLIVMGHCSPNAQAIHIAEKILTIIAQPIMVDTQIVVRIGVSIGIASFPGHGNSADELIKAADVAMYEVKRKGKHGYGIKDINGSMLVELFNTH